ncbi:MAG: DNA helicase [Promethearchaeota archaeon]|nr:MAG: DNA helicase [Candidatus Lokiarchaeota archaeon]
MSPDQEDPEEEHVFEFIDNDFDLNFQKSKRPPIEEYNKVNFEENLNDEQLEIVKNIKGPMLVIAGAGSGKTRTIVYSVAKLLLSGIRPDEIMLVTFTNKAANEMIRRVEELLGKRPKGIWAGTFHSIANRFIRKYAKRVGLKPTYTIMDETDAKALMKLSIERANVEELEERFPTAKMCKSILSYSINCNKKVKEVLSWKYPQFENEKVIPKLNEVFKRYKKRKAKDNLVDFDDLLVYWSQILDERSIAQKVASQIKYVLVDEYQDTNYIQDEIIHKIVKQNSEHNVMVVGDDAQSIYAFRGANFENILKFPENYKNCKKYKITFNYRSVPEILELANESIEKNEKQFHKDMKAVRKSGKKPYQVNTGDDNEQARFIANQVLRLRSKGYKLSEMAVLFRAGFHSMKIELELQNKNIPYEVRAGVSFFERAHIKDLLFHLRIIQNPRDEVAWHRIFGMIDGLGRTSGIKIFNVLLQLEDPLESIFEANFFRKHLSGKRIPSKGWKRFKSHVKQLLGVTPQDDPSEIILRINKVIEEHIKSKYENWEDRLEDLHQLSVYAQNFDTLQRFLENLSLNTSNIEAKTVKYGHKTEEEEPLVLSTIHRAKGLEWSVVFIPMLAENFFPSGRVIGDAEEFEEERRVFYVAVTRAKNELYLITPGVVQQFGDFQTTRLSQFISELDPKVYKKSSVRFRRKKKKPSSEALFQSADDLL